MFVPYGILCLKIFGFKNNLQEIGAWGAGGIHKKQTLFFGFTFLEMFAKVRTTAVYKYGA